MLDEGTGTLVFTGTVGRVQETAEAYARILDANLFFAQTAGATLAREPGSGMIVLQRQLELDGLVVERFENALRDFADATERLRRALSEVSDTAVPDYPVSSAGGELPEHFMRA